MDSIGKLLIQDQKRQLIEDAPREEVVREKRANSRSRSNSYEKKATSHRYQKYENEQSISNYERKRGRDSSRSPDARNRNNWDSRRIRYMIPMLDGPLVSLRQFMDLQTDRVDANKAEQHYIYYKKNWEKRQNEIFVKEHMEEAWFKEKYDPFISESIQNERQIEIKKIADDFFAEYASGFFDQVCLEISESTIQEIQTAQESNDDQMEDNEPKNTVHAHQKVFFGDALDVTKAPYFGFDPTARTLFIKTIPKELGRQDIYDIIQKVPGFVSLSISEPVPSQQFQRYGWIVFESEDKCAYACERFKSDCLVINKQELSIVRNSQKRMLKVALKVSHKKSRADFEAVLKLIGYLDASKGIITNPLLEVNVTDFSYKHLDVCLLYLRRVHSYCYYSGVQSLDERMLTSKCGSIHLRLRPESNSLDADVSDSQVPETIDWQDKALESANNKISEIEQQKTQLKGVAMFKEKLAQKIIYNVKKLMKAENGAWPCIYCTKKFKDAEFVVKHIDNKHSTEDKYLQEIEKMRSITIQELYSMDKNKIMHQVPNKEGAPFPYRQRKFHQGQNHSQQFRDRHYGQRKPFHGNQHVPFRDLDEPEPQNDAVTTNNFGSTINYLEI